MLKKILTCAVMLTVLTGCKQIKATINQTLNGGTVAGAAYCSELNSNRLISDESIRASCIKKFEKELPNSVTRSLDGRAGPSKNANENVFSGSVENNSDQYVVTQITVNVIFRENDETKEVTTVQIEGWFEPNVGPQKFISNKAINPPEDWTTAPYCNEGNTNRCWGWSPISSHGLKL